MDGGAELDYLESERDLGTPEAVSAYDELPLWSAMAGLLLLKHLPLRPGMRVLDVGCGTGFPILELAGRLGPSSELSAIDPWAPALERARAKAVAYGVSNVDIRDGDATAMPFPDASFDLVVSNLGLNNFSDPDSALRECRRVLAADGRLVLTTNLQGHMREFYDVFAAVLTETGHGELLEPLERHIEHRASIAGLEALFGRCGFRLGRVEREMATLRFADGSALLRHYFIRLGFLPAWKEIVPAEARAQVFGAIEERLNAIAAKEGEVRLTVPFAYVEGEPT